MPPAGLVVLPDTQWETGRYLSRSVAGLVILQGHVINGAGESKYTTLRTPGAGAGYQVTAGKTLYLTALRFRTALLDLVWQTVSGTSDVGIGSVAAPVGVMAEDSMSDGVGNGVTTRLAAVLEQTTDSILIKVAAGRFVAVRNLTALSELYIRLLGHEE